MDPERLINHCIAQNLTLRKIKYESETAVTFYIGSDDYDKFKELAGMRYSVAELGEFGYLHRLIGVLRKRALLAGVLVFLSIMIYQSLFISQIEVLGYEAINEQALRKSLNEAGFYEGCRKSVDIEKVKLHLYDDFDNIAWIGIKYYGNLAQVSVVETKYVYEKKTVGSASPCNIVAAVGGYINSVDPEEGVRVVDDGSYVKEGDVVISGEVPLTKTTYENEDSQESVSYVHAAGTVDAKVPVRLNYCVENRETIKAKTGRRMITVSINDKVLLKSLCPYELSSVKRKNLCNWIKPLRLKLDVNLVEEVELKYRKIPEKEINNMVLNKMHNFVEEKLPDNTQILNKSLNFRQEKNIIYIGVTLETLQEIGKEEEIIVDKSNRQSDQNDDQ
jgi:similar to stage IV sporulation protein